MVKLHFLLFFFFLINYINGFVYKNKKSRTKRFFNGLKKKYKNFKERYKKSFKLKEKDVVGDYQIKAYFNFDDKFEKDFKWKLFYIYSRRGKSLCQYFKLRKKYKQKYESKSFSFKKYFSDVNFVYTQFTLEYTHIKFNVNLEEKNKILVSYNPNITDKIIKSLTNLINGQDVKRNKKPPSWKLTFNFVTGKKRLIISIPSEVPGLFFTFYYEIVAYKYYFSNPFSYFGDIYFRFGGNLKKYKVGYFDFSKI
ncbi:conserved Plasmodium protein, unknown function [Plasmodium gallinaceum]|uniref:Uncharacterized protein n=1 Tax=Plasmodium gallinaceum TaxID=5849 RepID=A0A1J1GSD0_PLAGA|nr:conserved Plasmodium protein, unknown function [Plasmodium gallinaceum]CRG95213.1 conserved Plasmodium protein, unknown function [Plasmodium gallinaceum]